MFQSNVNTMSMQEDDSVRLKSPRMRKQKIIHRKKHNHNKVSLAHLMSLDQNDPVMNARIKIQKNIYNNLKVQKRRIISIEKEHNMSPRSRDNISVQQLSANNPSVNP